MSEKAFRLIRGVFEVGQVPFYSKATGCNEYLPIAISLLASPGTTPEKELPLS